MRTRRQRIHDRIQALPGASDRRLRNLPEASDRVTSSSLAWFVSYLRSGELFAPTLGEARIPFRASFEPCPGCGGPDDHYPDCLPASQGGTQRDVERIP